MSINFGGILDPMLWWKQSWLQQISKGSEWTFVRVDISKYFQLTFRFHQKGQKEFSLFKKNWIISINILKNIMGFRNSHNLIIGYLILIPNLEMRPKNHKQQVSMQIWIDTTMEKISFNSWYDFQDGDFTNAEFEFGKREIYIAGKCVWTGPLVIWKGYNFPDQ